MMAFSVLCLKNRVFKMIEKRRPRGPVQIAKRDVLEDAYPRMCVRPVG